MSSPTSAGGSSPAILTPSRRVKALLAQFDDSNSEDEAATRPSRAKTAANVTPPGRPAPDPSASASLQPALENSDGDEDQDEDSLPIAPRGRLVSRLQAQITAEDDSASDVGDGGSAYDRIKSQMQRLQAKTADSAKPTNTTGQSNSEDDLTRTVPKRRTIKRKSRPVAENPQNVASPRSRSPLFFPSPIGAERPSRSPRSDKVSGLYDLPANRLTSNSSRFLELVEKHRKQRLAQEAADIVKRAARVEQLKSLSKSSGRPRGSSPADDSDEDSDLSNHDVSRKMSKASRPTRKASKKAIDEMNRETQRMTRNMQLAHQAKTKKKITKESLLARFDFPLPDASKIGIDEAFTKSGTASSAPTSDAEGARKHDTPPTSPLLPELSEKDKPHSFLPPAEVFDSTIIERHDEEQRRTMEDILAQPIQSREKGKGKAAKEQFGMDSEPNPFPKLHKKPRPIRVKWSKEDAVIARAADSDSDLEIVTSNSKTRKVAVFETSFARKARETSSHLALRSLAHITDSTDKKRSFANTAQMEADLRKIARLQARKERQEKIEELKTKGVVIQSAEEREKDQQEIEDLVERARQEASEIHKREKATAKKEGTFVKDGLGDDDSDDAEDGDFEDDDDAEVETIDEEEEEDDDEGADNDDEDEDEGADEEDGGVDLDGPAKELIDQEAEDQGSDLSEEDAEEEQLETFIDDGEEDVAMSEKVPRRSRNTRVLSDDEEEDSTKKDDPTPPLPAPATTTKEAQEPSPPALAKTPQSVPRSVRKMIPGLQMSDDLPMGLTQAFAATMADSQSHGITFQTQEQDSFVIARELPSPGFPILPNLRRLESLDVITDSQPASQTQPLDLDLSFSQSQQVSQFEADDISSTQLSQMPFEPTQDVGFVLSPFAESRFDTPLRADAPQSTIETVILPRDEQQSPIMQRKGRLRRGRAATMSDNEAGNAENNNSAFDVMQRAAAHKEAAHSFDKSKSHAKDIVDEAAEESEDEYAGLGGASDDEVGEEDEEDRKMIDRDEKLGQGDEAKLAGLFADNERKQDEAVVSKLLKDITTGALRRKRGVGDDLDLSDEEDEAARRREAKRREFARMRRELLKDEAVGKIAEDKKKEAFLKSIEDQEVADEDDLELDAVETEEQESQSQQRARNAPVDAATAESHDPSANRNKRKRPLEASAADALNRLPPALRHTNPKAGIVSRRPSSIAEIRESVCFLIEEPDSQSPTPQYGSSDDEDADMEAYVNLDRHLQAADENEDDGEDLGDFIVDDSQDNDGFKKPQLPPSRAPFTERRTKADVVDRRSLLRQASSSSSTASATSKMAFFASKAGSSDSFAFKVPSLLRRATTNSSFGSVSNAKVSATGVSVATERGAPDQEKEVIRKGAGGRRNAVNFRVKPKEEQMKSRVTAKKGKVAAKAGGSGFLGGLFRGDSWA